ncbi:hypothetical protein GEV33_002166 [Tenebrio molitor]|uniref:Transmembrane protein n=1 Tax=Tenebrio molitor TaxID=7067 RepID=A0A8J6LG90_TENMO|nr:hypothetical protein GEV33_002166 [Tenebrio molitor]
MYLSLVKKVVLLNLLRLMLLYQVKHQQKLFLQKKLSRVSPKQVQKLLHLKVFQSMLLVQCNQKGKLQHFVPVIYLKVVLLLMVCLNLLESQKKKVNRLFKLLLKVPLLLKVCLKKPKLQQKDHLFTFLLFTNPNKSQLKMKSPKQKKNLLTQPLVMYLKAALLQVYQNMLQVLNNQNTFQVLLNQNTFQKEKLLKPFLVLQPVFRQLKFLKEQKNKRK